MKRVKNNRNYLILFITIFFQFICLSREILASPATNMFNNPIILYDVKGINPFPSPTTQSKMALDVLPYYNNANSSKNGKGKKVYTGDRLGRWSMLGLLEGTKASPGVDVNGNLDPVLFPVLREAQDQIQGQLDEKGIFLQEGTFTGSNILGNYTIPIDYEQFGIRGCARVTLVHGIGVRVRSGFAAYSQEVEFIDLSQTTTVFGLTITNTVNTLLMSKGKRKAIAKEIGLSMNNHATVAMEDTHVELHWANEFAMKLEADDPIVNVIPHIAIGAWLPTGKRQNQDIAFSLPTGNGVWGVTLEGELNIKFPKIVQLGFGGAITFWGSRTGNFRIPTAQAQSNLYPWKIHARRKYGPSWNLHADFCAEYFLNRLSFYLNFIYARNEKSHFKLNDTPERKALFIKSQAERETIWVSKKFYFGFDYPITKNLALGIGVMAPINEMRAYRTVTIFGTIRFSFF